MHWGSEGSRDDGREGGLARQLFFGMSVRLAYVTVVGLGADCANLRAYQRCLVGNEDGCIAWQSNTWCMQAT